ncbi:MAG: hypothetical protein KDJ36_03550 [Hyphomicrobiaceae bacterium]|nr:hypothetical protein [Hyphomicrobiaceae bacterium]
MRDDHENHANVREAVEATAERRRIPSRALWAGLGFAAGVAAWHFVGFWAFVSDVVLTGRAPQGKLTTMILAPPPPPLVKAAVARARMPVQAVPARQNAPAAQPTVAGNGAPRAAAPETVRRAPPPAPATWSTSVTTSSID